MGSERRRLEIRDKKSNSGGKQGERKRKEKKVKERQKEESEGKE